MIDAWKKEIQLLQGSYLSGRVHRLSLWVFELAWDFLMFLLYWAQKLLVLYLHVMGLYLASLLAELVAVKYSFNQNP